MSHLGPGVSWAHAQLCDLNLAPADLLITSLWLNVGLFVQGWPGISAWWSCDQAQNWSNARVTHRSPPLGLTGQSVWLQCMRPSCQLLRRA